MPFPCGSRISSLAIAQILALILVASLTSPARGQSSATDYPLCPFSGNYPSKPNVTMTRCPGAQEYTCCQDCYDRYVGLLEVSANSSLVIDTVAPGLGELLAGVGLVQLCGSFAGFPDCQFILEQSTCALHCYPDMGNYVQVDSITKPKLASIQFCKSYVEQAYAACNAIAFPGSVTIADIFPTSKSFFETAFSKIIAAFEPYKLNVTIDESGSTDRCFAGSPGGLLPSVPTCCDPLAATKECPLSKLQVDTHPQFPPYIGRKLDPRACADYLSPPTPPAAAPSPPPSSSLTPPSPSLASPPTSPTGPTASSPPSPPSPSSKPARLSSLPLSLPTALSVPLSLSLLALLLTA